MMKRNKSYKYILMSLVLIIGLFFSTFKVESFSKNETRTALDPSPILYAGAMDTGASSASRDYKGGIIFLEPNTQYTMKGGTYSGGNKTYGGAVYISEGATFTMDGGTITNCKATYGGGIYVRAGATCNILSGSITGCSATYGPAIFVEDGGILNIEDGVDISDNDIYIDKGIDISKDTIAIGNVNENIQLHYTYFGSYPQTHVTDTALINQLNNLKGGTPVQTYTLGDLTWNAYMHTDGEIYVYGVGKQSRYASYKDGGEVSEDEGDWFKVEPIRWYVLNYDSKGSEGYELFSELVLGANITFSSSWEDNSWVNSILRTWCNSEFLFTAFTSEEQQFIPTTEVKNNVTGDFENPTSDGKGTTTRDRIYFKSYYEMNSGYFTTDNSRAASPSDFCVANGVDSYDDRCPTIHRKDLTSCYWLRSAMHSAQYTCNVTENGHCNKINLTADNGYPIGVRPALHINI